LYDDGKTAYPTEAFAHMTDRSIEEMMKTVTRRYHPARRRANIRRAVASLPRSHLRPIDDIAKALKLHFQLSHLEIKIAVSGRPL
jgi:hypothetical protein